MTPVQIIELMTLELLVKGSFDPKVLKPHLEMLQETLEGRGFDKSLAILNTCFDARGVKNKNVYDQTLKTLEQIVAALNSGNNGGETAPGGDEGQQRLVYDVKQSESILQSFLSETGEHLQNLEQELILLERKPGNRETLDIIFGHLHAVKGLAGFISATQVQTLAHHSESVLEQARQRGRARQVECDAIFRTVDMLRGFIKLIETHTQQNSKPLPFLPTAFVALLRELYNLLQNGASISTSNASSVELLSATAQAKPGLSTEQKSAPNPAPAAKTANSAPPATSAPVEKSAIPESDWIATAGRQKKEKLAPVKPEQKAAPVTAAKPGNAVVGRASQPLQSASGKPSNGTVILPKPQVQTSQKKTQIFESDSNVRIRMAKLEALMNQISELVISQNQVSHDPLMRQFDGTEFGQKIAHVGNVMRSLQALSMELRMFPVREVTMPLTRVIRDLAQARGKEIEVVAEGDDTELDKSMLQSLSDVLGHLVRNAIDHGIELPEERKARGKQPKGRISFKAWSTGGRVCVELSDDGRGLNAERIKARAIHKGLLKAGEQASDEMLKRFIFMPGFSTAEKITEISGRGIGLDAVQRDVQRLGGTLTLTDRPGEGTTFTLALPLTVFMVDGLLTSVGTERYVIPLPALTESLRPTAGQVSTVMGQGELLELRGHQLPLVRLGDFAGHTARQRDPQHAVILIVHAAGEKFALMVDDVLGEQQVVLKPLGEGLKRVRGVAGGTILADGRVGLVLDTAEILTFMRANTARAFAQQN